MSECIYDGSGTLDMIDLVTWDILISKLFFLRVNLVSNIK